MSEQLRGELLAKATAGKWLVANQNQSTICTETEDGKHTCLSAWGDYRFDHDPQRESDAALIVAMRNELPAILDRLEKLERFVADVDEGKIKCGNFVNCGVEDAVSRLDP